MKRFKKVFVDTFILLLSISIMLCNMAPVVYADGNYGYVEIQYIDVDTGTLIQSTQTRMSVLDSEGNGKVSLNASDFSAIGYMVHKSGRSNYNDINKKTVYLTDYELQNGITVDVNSNCTVTNPVMFYIYFDKAASESIPVEMSCVYQYSDGVTPDQYKSIKNAQATYPNGLNDIYNVDPSTPDCKYIYNFIYYEYKLGTRVPASASVAGTLTENGVVNLKYPPAGVQKIDCYWYFDAGNVQTNNIIFNVVDNFIDPDTGKPSTGINGADYFGREALEQKSYTTGQEVRVMSPTKGLYTKPDGTTQQLTLNKVVYEKLQGDPVKALDPANQNAVKSASEIPADTTTSFEVNASTTIQYIHYYWNYSGGTHQGGDSDGGGKIIFIPNSTNWTNKGKLFEGQGSYPVEVKYVGNNPVVLQGTATIIVGATKAGPIYGTVSFPVSYNLKSITVTGDANSTVNGADGNVYIAHEGGNLHLHGVGTWGPAQYSAPGGAVSTSIPSPPAQPIGDSGIYKLDWTKPKVDFNVQPGIFSTDRGAIRQASQHGSDEDGYFGVLTVKDLSALGGFGDGNESGVASIKYSWTFDNVAASNWTTIFTSPSNADPVIRQIEKPVGDNLYLHVSTIDIAGNENNVTFGPYEDPIKLKNFEVTDVRDPAWDSVFWKDPFAPQPKGFQHPTGVTYMVKQLPIDGDSHPKIKNTYPKKGYAFYFDVTSEYLYRDNDRIEVIPSLYYWDGKNRVPVDCYYYLDGNPFIKMGSSKDTLKLHLDTKKHGSVTIGTLSKLTLTRDVRVVRGKEWGDWKGNIQYQDGKTQWWFGKYLLPATSMFVKHGDKPVPQNILKDKYIIIQFDIVGYKNGIETSSQDQVFTYVPSQWTNEGGTKSNIYKSGDVMVYDNKYSALSNYRAYITQ